MASSKLSFEDIQTLWKKNGGNQYWAALAAGIAIAESGGNYTALNSNASTGDYSVGLWQINYYNGLAASRTAEFGSAASLQVNPDAQAKAAITLSGNGSNWGPWKNDPVWNQWQAAGAPHYPSNADVQSYISNSGASDSAASGNASVSSGTTTVTAVDAVWPLPISIYSTIPTATQGFGTLTLGDITINGGPLDSNIAAAVTDVIVERNIASASTVTIQVSDPTRYILRSQLLNYTDVLELDGLLFALVEITKTGDQIQFIFEAYGVFLLRQEKGTTASSTTSNITAFAEQLVSAIPGLGFIGENDKLATAIAVGRGTTANPYEDSWTCLVRIAATAGWRLFESNNVIHFGSDPFWAGFPSVAVLQEFTPGIQNIDFDYDIGQPFGNLTVTGVSALWDYPPGSVVTTAGMGPANGVWLVNDMQRDFYSPQMTLTLQQALTPDQFLNPSQADLGITGISSSEVA